MVTDTRDGATREALEVDEALSFARVTRYPCTLPVACALLLILEACGGKVVEVEDAGINTSSCATIGMGPSTTHYVLGVSFLGRTSSLIVFDAAVEIDAGEMCMSLQLLAAADRKTPVGAAADGGP